MCDKNKMTDVKYTQLNERSRWYTKHLWQVPFAYVAIIAWSIEKLPAVQTPLRGLITISLGFFSLSVLVFVIHLKYYERRAVRTLQEFEQNQITKPGGGSPWFISFAWYTRLLLIFAIYSFLIVGTYDLGIPKEWTCPIIGGEALSVTVLIASILAYDYKRSNKLISEIKDKMK